MAPPQTRRECGQRSVIVLGATHPGGLAVNLCAGNAETLVARTTDHDEKKWSTSLELDNPIPERPPQSNVTETRAQSGYTADKDLWGTGTTTAALFGGLPLALSTGTGSELRRPLGIAIVGGLLVSQVLSLYTTPVVYLYLDRLRLWCEGFRHGSLKALTSKPSEV